MMNLPVPRTSSGYIPLTLSISLLILARTAGHSPSDATLYTARLKKPTAGFMMNGFPIFVTSTESSL